MAPGLIPHRYVVAANFTGADGKAVRGYFSGLFRMGQKGWNSCEPVAVEAPERAWRMSERDTAERIAVALTEICATFPPRDARTWFALELPAALSETVERIKDAARGITPADGEWGT